MPRDGSGIFVAPYSDVITATTIESGVHNGTVADFVADANAARPVIAGGTGATSAPLARANLKTEVASQQVTNYNSHVWEAGSFWSNVGATAAPSGNLFTGTCTPVEGNPAYLTVEARDQVTGIRYYCIKYNGEWTSWITEGTAVGGAGFVSDTGDTMTGPLTVPALYLLNGSNYITADGTNFYLRSGASIHIQSTAGTPLPLYVGTPAQPEQATTKAYVDSGVAAINSSLVAVNNNAVAADNNANTRVLRSGDTMTGTLTAPTYQINSPDYGQLSFFRSAILRWGIRGTDTTTCNLEFHRYGVGGAYAGPSLILANASGDATFYNSVNVTAYLNCDYAAAASSPSTGAIRVPNGGIGTRGIWVAAPDVHNVSVFGGSSGGGAQVEIAWGSSGGWHGLSIRDMTTGGLGAFTSFIRDDAYLQGFIGGTGVGVNYNTASDASLKENIRPAREVFDSKAALRAVQVSHFRWKGTDREQVGLLAQQVDETLPGVATPPQPHVKIAEDGTQTMGETPWVISYGNAVPYVIDVVQQQGDEIDAITGELATAKQTINTLVARIEALERKLKQ